jgi:hypothetical protein
MYIHWTLCQSRNERVLSAECAVLHCRERGREREREGERGREREREGGREE